MYNGAFMLRVIAVQTVFTYLISFDCNSLWLRVDHLSSVGRTLRFRRADWWCQVAQKTGWSQHFLLFGSGFSFPCAKAWHAQLAKRPLADLLPYFMISVPWEWQDTPWPILLRDCSKKKCREVSPPLLLLPIFFFFLILSRVKWECAFKTFQPRCDC